jgi:HK97 family phage major capsid protein
MEIRKALDLASSAAAYFIPDVIDGSIRDFAAKVPTLYNVVNKRSWATNTYWIRKRLSLPGASWSIDGGPLPAATQSTYGRTFKTMKYLYTRGEVTGPMIQAAGSTFDALGMSVEEHQQTMVERLSTDIAIGNGAQNDITGILHQITDDADLYTATGGQGAVVDGDGEDLTLNMLDRAIDAASDIGVGGGRPNMIVTTRPVARMINSLLAQMQQFVNVTEIAAGFRVRTYDGIAITTDNHWKDNSKILIFDSSKATLLVHKDFTYEELAKTKDSVDFMIKWYGGFVLEGAASLLTNFTLTADI